MGIEFLHYRSFSFRNSKEKLFSVRPTRLKLAIYFLASATSPVAFAGFFVEPTAGYTVGVLGQPGVPTLDSQAFLFGGRLGYRFSERDFDGSPSGGFKFGVDYSMGFGTATQMGNAGAYRPMDIGAFVGVDLPLNFGAYFSAYLYSKAKMLTTEYPADFSGQSYRLGVGWSPVTFCSILFEATYRFYSRYDGIGLSNAIKGMMFGGSISFPLP